MQSYRERPVYRPIARSVEPGVSCAFAMLWSRSILLNVYLKHRRSMSNSLWPPRRKRFLTQLQCRCVSFSDPLLLFANIENGKRNRLKKTHLNFRRYQQRGSVFATAAYFADPLLCYCHLLGVAPSIIQIACAPEAYKCLTAHWPTGAVNTRLPRSIERATALYVAAACFFSPSRPVATAYTPQSLLSLLSLQNMLRSRTSRKRASARTLQHGWAVTEYNPDTYSAPFPLRQPATS